MVFMDMSLQFVLNRLNHCENNREKQLKSIKNLQKQIFELNNKIILLKELKKS